MRSCGASCWTVSRGVIEEGNGENDDHQDVTTEQLVQGVARKGNERGANVHEKSLIWAAKDTERKKLEEKGAVRILTGDSAEKAKAQISNRFIPSRFVVTRPCPDEFKARCVCEATCISMSWNLLAVAPLSLQLCHSWDECFLVR